ncbi:BACON domain-containing protein [Streptomyces sp. NBC_00388]|uniref:BACON domain-containing protein n=1 Tax=Streptomyces sp. NBC_00388 TaxID=2975735 RepID=UPI002E1F86CB
MTSSRLENPTHTTGAHRAHRRAPQPAEQRPPVRYEAYLDGLFTYCLSVLCDHTGATAVLGEVLAVSERQFSRCPAGEQSRRAWLYALARWACLRKLAEQKRLRPGAHAGRAPEPEPAPGPEQPAAAETAERQRRDLATLAWPEAAGTTPEQREALELAVRHGLGSREVAAVLGLEHTAARELLAAGACEVERTRAALAVVETGNCPSVARLTGDNRVLLSTALRRELVRHVDDCPRCRRVAERAGATGPWPGSTVTPPTPAALPLVVAERSAAYGAMLHAPRGHTPRFGRTGFPLDPKDRAARRDRMRSRAVTTTVVATVVAAPVLALWVAYRHAPATGEGHGGSVTASEAGGPGRDGASPYDHYENAGSASTPRTPLADDGSSPDVSVEVISPDAGKKKTGGGSVAPGGLTVAARASGGRTSVTLTNEGDRPLSWSAARSAPWLYLSSASGVLSPGGSITLRVYVDHRSEPAGAWSARIAFDPSGAVVVMRGYGWRDGTHGHGHGHGHHGHGRPTPSGGPTTGPAPTGRPTPTPTPSDPTPTPTPTASDPPASPSPSAPGTPSPA